MKRIYLFILSKQNLMKENKKLKLRSVFLKFIVNNLDIYLTYFIVEKLFHQGKYNIYI